MKNILSRPYTYHPFKERVKVADVMISNCPAHLRDTHIRFGKQFFGMSDAQLCNQLLVGFPSLFLDQLTQIIRVHKKFICNVV